MAANSLPKGKSAVTYVLPEKLIRRLALQAVEEHTSRSRLVERLVLLGIEAEASAKDGGNPGPKPKPKSKSRPKSNTANGSRLADRATK